MAQMLQPTSMDHSRDIARQESSPKEHQIQATEAPSAQAQTTNSTSDSIVASDTKEILEFILRIKEMQNSGELPNRGAVIDLHT